jgi:phenylpropionate dioxygenase-like ring-hydroxylating dioxygenase large terminal subunit
MIRYDSTSPVPGSPPGFLEAKNRRQKARAAGLSPDYFYPVARSGKLRRGQVLGTRFWDRPIAVFRDESGQVHAIEDRCAHRQLKLSLGQVKGCNLVCQYHGWEYNGDGKVVGIPHELFGKPFPNLKVGGFPAQERYGLIWIFPGNPALAELRRIPDIPELEGKERWGLITIDCEWKTHHSMVMDNLSDLTHAYPYPRHKRFSDAKMTRCEALGDRVYVSYDTEVGGGNILRRFVDKRLVSSNHIDLCYEYPYQWSRSGDKIKHHCFVLPLDARTTHAFFLFYFKSPRVPFMPLAIPPWLLNHFLGHFSGRLLGVANEWLGTPLIPQDRRACEAELEGYTRYYDAPVAEFNPAVGLGQQLIIRKWEEYLTSRHLTNSTATVKCAGTAL